MTKYNKSFEVIFIYTLSLYYPLGPNLTPYASDEKEITGLVAQDYEKHSHKNPSYHNQKLKILALLNKGWSSTVTVSTVYLLYQ